MRPVPLGGLAAQEGAALFVFFWAQILKKIQNGHNTNHGLVVDFTQSPFFLNHRQSFVIFFLHSVETGMNEKFTPDPENCIYEGSPPQGI